MLNRGCVQPLSNPCAAAPALHPASSLGETSPHLPPPEHQHASLVWQNQHLPLYRVCLQWGDF